MQYTQITPNVKSANCPKCGVYSSFNWTELYTNLGGLGFRKTEYYAGLCRHCNEMALWKKNNWSMIDPINGSIPPPNNDLSEDIKLDYIEASNIVNISPRGAVALLRLAVQKLCKQLGEKGDNINRDIKSLVSKGLNPMIQKALDGVRVTGNNAVHPGTIDLKDDTETAVKVFGLINVIAEIMITQPKMIDQFYDKNLTDRDKELIQKRDDN